ncbi:hypothetical protein B0H13DRAFT_1978258 [Mycena leptocephala]|nr:hypothetical protein B0H13DRAFT_1978258 [Mycena leptocephala]
MRASSSNPWPLSIDLQLPLPARFPIFQALCTGLQYVICGAIFVAMPFLWNFILRSIGMGSYGVDTATVDYLTMHDITMHTCQKISQCIGIWLEQMARSHPKPCLIMHISDNAWPSEDFGRAPDHMHFEIVNCILKEVIRVLFYNHKDQVNGRTTREAARAGAQGTKTDAAGKSELPPASDVSKEFRVTQTEKEVNLDSMV